MNLLTSLVSVVAVAAPPPKAAPDSGRISLTVDGKFIDFRPDGTDLTSFTIPEGVVLPRNAFTLTHDHKFAVHFDQTGRTGNKRKTKLVVTPVVPKGQPFVLDGYVALRRIVSRDGTKVYFAGCKGDEFDASTDAEAGYVLDFATKQVATLPLPARHKLHAVSPDGKTFLTIVDESQNDTITRRTFLVRAGEKPVEILRSNFGTTTVASSKLSFSPDGSKILMECAELLDLKLRPDGTVLPGETKSSEYLMLDVATKTTRPFKAFKNHVMSWDWSPNGTKIAFAKSVISRGADGQPDRGLAFAVCIADATTDGEDSTEILTSKYGVPQKGMGGGGQNITGSLGSLKWR